MGTATDALEQLVRRMGDQPGAMAMSVVDELGESWGPKGDPTWVEGLVPGYGDHEPEVDYLFALYQKPRIYAWARLRGDSGDPPAHMRMILRVITKPPDHVLAVPFAALRVKRQLQLAFGRVARAASQSTKPGASALSHTIARDKR
jgi:hypothetical protein